MQKSVHELRDYHGELSQLVDEARNLAARVKANGDVLTKFADERLEVFNNDEIKPDEEVELWVKTVSV